MFKKKTKLHLKPIPRGFYAFNIERAVDFLIYVEMENTSYKFLYVPGADPFYLSFQDFTESIQKGVLSFVEQLPEDIYKESILLSCPA
jgi:hypothetical protein